MNILITVHDSISPIYGGGALRTLKVAKELKKRKHNVILLAPSKKNIVEDIPVAVLPTVTKKLQLWTSIRFNILLFIKLIKCLPKTNLIFSHNAVSGLLCSIFCKIAKFFGLKKFFVLDITDLHTEYIKYSPHPKWLNFIIPILTLLEYYTAKNADLVIAVTYVMKNYLIKKGVKPQKVEVVYDGVDVSHYSSEKIEDSLNAIHIGSIEKTDGVETLINAIPKVVKKNPDFKFYFVGGGVDIDKMKLLTKKLAVDKNCIFTDWVDYTIVKDYMKKQV